MGSVNPFKYIARQDCRGKKHWTRPPTPRCGSILPHLATRLEQSRPGRRVIADTNLRRFDFNTTVSKRHGEGCCWPYRVRMPGQIGLQWNPGRDKTQHDEADRRRGGGTRLNILPGCHLLLSHQHRNLFLLSRLQRCGSLILKPVSFMTSR